MAQTFGFMLSVLGLESQVLGLGLGLVAYVLGLVYRHPSLTMTATNMFSEDGMTVNSP